MNVDQKKSEIVSAIREELLRLRIPIEDRDIRSSVDGNSWSIWIEQEKGLNTSDDKFLVNLTELKEGVNYVVAVGYRARRWASRFKLGYVSKLKGCTVLMAEDDQDDRLLMKKAFEENRIENPLIAVSDGEQIINYLYRRGEFSNLDKDSSPCLILLDLNMPKMDGREALKIIKKDKNLRKIPVVILTTSKSEDDVLYGYETGANSFITKPFNFEGLLKVVKNLQTYWLETVQLPSGEFAAN